MQLGTVWWQIWLVARFGWVNQGLWGKGTQRSRGMVKAMFGVELSMKAEVTLPGGWCALYLDGEGRNAKDHVCSETWGHWGESKRGTVMMCLEVRWYYSCWV